MFNDLRETTEWADLITDIKTSLRPELLNYLNLEVETDIVRAIVNNIFNPNILEKKYREILDEIIENKSFFYWGSNCYVYESIVDDTLFHTVLDDIIDFVDYRYRAGKHNELLSKYLTDPNISEDDYTDSLVDFCSDLCYEDGICVQHEDLEIYKTNPLINDIYEKYISKITEYNIAMSHYEIQEDSFREKLENDLEKIVKPNIHQKITKNDKNLLRLLTDTYSNYEMSLLIWSRNIIVSNAIAEKYKISIPFSKPGISDYIYVEKDYTYQHKH